MKHGLILFLICLSAQLAISQELVIDNQGHSGIVADLAFTKGGDFLISSSSDKTVRVWNVASGELYKTYRFEQESGANGKIYASAVTPNERHLFIGGFFSEPGSDGRKVGEIRVLDLFNEKMARPAIGHTNVILDLAISSDGSKLMSTSADKTIKVWNIRDLGANSAPILEQTINLEIELNCIAINSDGTMIAGGDASGFLRTWDISGSQPVADRSKIHRDEVRYLAFTNDNTGLYSCGDDGQVVKWTPNGKFMGFFAKLPGPVGVIEISTDDKYLTAMGRAGMVYDLATGTALSSFDLHSNSVSAIASAPFASFGGKKGSYLASAGGDNKNIFIWDVVTGDVVRNFVGSGNSVFAVGVDKNNQNVVGFGQDNPTGNLDDTRIEKTFNLSDFLLEGGEMDQINFRRSKKNGNGKYIGKESNNSFSIGDDVISTDEIEDGYVRTLTYVQDDKGIVLGSSFTLKKYSAEGSFIGSFRGHEGETWAVSEMTEKGILVSGNSDQTVKFWNIENGENLLTLFVADDNEWVIWTPQGFYEASAGGEKYIGWHINKGRNKLAEFHDVSAFSEHYHRRDVIEKILELRSFEAVAVELDLKLKPEEVIVPPEISWVAPEAATSIVNGNSTVLTFTVNSKLPINHVKLFADGRPVVNDNEVNISGDNVSEDVDITLTVPEGNNKTYSIRLFVSDGKSKVTSAEKMISFRAPETAEFKEVIVDVDDNEFVFPEEPEDVPVQTAAAEAVPANVPVTGGDRSRLTLDPVVDDLGTPRNLYVVSIGVSEFENPDYNLNYAEADASSISELFKDQRGKLYKNVKSISLVNQEATRARILKTFANLEKYTTVDDMVIIFLASHGMNINDKFYFVPHDGDANSPRASCLDWRDFSDLVGNMKAKVLLFIDTCHSGQLGNTLPNKQKSQDNTEAVREVSSKEYGVIVMAAATGYEYSLEHPDWGHGAFTLSIIEGLGEGRADINPDGDIYLRELDYYLAERVRELTGGRQHPTTQKPSSISRLQLAKAP